MQKFSTSLKKTGSSSVKKAFKKSIDMQPSADTIENILRFAASYKAQKIADNQFVEWFVN